MILWHSKNISKDLSEYVKILQIGEEESIINVCFVILKYAQKN